jgi:hypothetical protein
MDRRPARLTAPRKRRQPIWLIELVLALSGIRPQAFLHEKGDCAVRAFQIAAGIPYARAHSLLKAAGRIDRRGTTNNTIELVAGILGLTEVGEVARYHGAGWQAPRA